MGNRGENADKGNEPTSIESKNFDNKGLNEPQSNPVSEDNAASNEPKLKKRVQEKTISPRNAEDGQEKKIKEKNDESTKINQRKNVTIIGDSILNG